VQFGVIHNYALNLKERSLSDTMDQIPPSIRQAAITCLKEQRLSLIRRLNDTEERIAAMETVETLYSSQRAGAIAYAMQIMKRLHATDT
jgi:hypothetical protein